MLRKKDRLSSLMANVALCTVLLSSTLSWQSVASENGIHGVDIERMVIKDKPQEIDFFLSYSVTNASSADIIITSLPFRGSLFHNGDLVSADMLPFNIGDARSVRYVPEPNYKGDDQFFFQTLVEVDGESLLSDNINVDIHIYESMLSELVQVGNGITPTDQDNSMTSPLISATGDFVVFSIPSGDGEHGDGIIESYSLVDGEWEMFGDPISAGTTLVDGVWVEEEDGYYTAGSGVFLGEALGLSSDGNTLIYMANEAGRRNPYVVVLDKQEGAWQKRGDAIALSHEPHYAPHKDKRIAISGDANMFVLGLSNNATFLTYHWDGESWVSRVEDLVVPAESKGMIGGQLGLSLDGTRMIIGDQNHKNGSVYIYDLVGDEWVRTFSVSGEDDGTIGAGAITSLSGDGKTLAFSEAVYVDPNTPDDDDDNAGVAIYKMEGDSWERFGKIYSYDDEDESPSNKYFDLSADGDTIAVGFPYEHGPGYGVTIEGNATTEYLGLISVFRLDDENWENSRVDFYGNYQQKIGAQLSLSDEGSTLASTSLYTVDSSPNYSVLVHDISKRTPVAEWANYSFNEDESFTFTLQGKVSGSSMYCNAYLDYESVHVFSQSEYDGCTYTLTPETNYNGEIILGFTVSDGDTSSEIANVVFSVLPVDDSPEDVFSSEGDNVALTSVGDSYSMTLPLTDADGEPLTYTINDAPANGEVVIDGNVVTYTGTATSIHSNDVFDEFSLFVSDGNDEYGLPPVKLIVLEDHVAAPISSSDDVNIDVKEQGSIFSDGYTVASSKNGDYAVVGVPLYTVSNEDYESLDGAGMVMVFKKVDGQWLSHGNTIYGTIEEQGIGFLVDISDDGSTILVSEIGAHKEASSISYQGGLDVYDLKEGEWVSIPEPFDFNDIGILALGSFAKLSGDGNSLMTQAFIGYGAGARLISWAERSGDEWVDSDAFLFNEFEFYDGQEHSYSYLMGAGASDDLQSVTLIEEHVVEVNTIVDGAVVSQTIGEDKGLKPYLVSMSGNGEHIVIAHKSYEGEDFAYGALSFASKIDGEWVLSEQRIVGDKSYMLASEIEISDSGQRITFSSVINVEEDYGASSLVGEKHYYHYELVDIDGEKSWFKVNTQFEEYESTVEIFDNFTTFNDGHDLLMVTSEGNDNNLTLSTLTLVNAKPVVSDLDVETNEDVPLNIAVSGSDADDHDLSYSFESVDDGVISSTDDGNVYLFTPAPNFFGEVTFEYWANDGFIDSEKATIKVDVKPINDHPVITLSSSISTEEDESETIYFTYSDIDGDEVVATLNKAPGHGDVTIEGAAITYSPDANYNGSDEFELELTDGNGYVTQRVVSVDVLSINDSPRITIEDTIVTNEDGDVVLDFSYEDADGDVVVATISSQANSGDITIDGTSVTYSPNENFYGSDTFTLSLTDGNGFVTTKTVSVTVESVNDEPVVTIDSMMTVDEDGVSSFTFTYYDVDGDAVTASVAESAKHGDVSVEGQRVTYSPTTNFYGKDSFVLGLTDAQGYESQQTVNVNVLQVNDAPVIEIANVLTVDEDGSQTLSFTYTDIDGDVVSASLSEQASHGDVVIDGRTISYTPDENFYGSDVFSVTLTDDQGYTELQSIAVTVISVNDDPVISIQNMITLSEDGTTTFTFTYTDVDGDKVTASLSQEAEHGDVSIKGEQISYTPEADFYGDDSFVLSMTDGNGYVSLKTINVTVLNVNDAPIISIANTLTVNEDDSQTISFTYTDIDGDVVSATISRDAEHGDVVVEGTDVSYTPEPNFYGSDEFELLLVDGEGFAGKYVVSINVVSVNDAPVISIAETLTVDEDAQQTLTFSYMDVDGDVVSATVSEMAAYGEVSIDGRNVSYSPDSDYYGSDSFSLLLTDSAGFETIKTISVTVISVNDAPVIVIEDTLTVDEDGLQTLSFSYTDVDGDVVTAFVSQNGTNGNVVISGTDVSYTPIANFFGSDQFELTLTDSNGFVTTKRISVNVISVNDNPIITIGDTLTVDEDGQQTLGFSYTDVDGDVVSASIKTQASFGTASVDGANVTYAPQANYYGNDTFSLLLTDSAGYEVVKSINVEVKSVNDEAIITIQSTLSIEEDGFSTFSFDYTDIDGDTVSATLKTEPENGEVVIDGKSISYSPDMNFYGTDTFVLLLEESSGVSFEYPISVTVTSVNDEPLITLADTLEINEDEPGVLTLTYSDVDGDVVSATVKVAPGHGEVVIDNENITYTPLLNFFGDDSFVLLLTDSNGYQKTHTVNVTVKSVNDAPKVVVNSMLTVDEDGQQTFSFKYVDVDGDVVIATLSQAPVNGVVTIDGETVSYVPNKDFFGEDVFALTFTDNAGYESTQEISVLVAAVNDDPIAIDDAFTLQAGGEYLLDVVKNDIEKDGEPIVIIHASIDVGVVTIENNQLKVSLDEEVVGEVVAQYTIQDDHRGRVTANVVITVENDNDSAPYITLPDDINVQATGLLTKVDVGMASAIDVDGNPISVTIINPTQHFAPGRHAVIWQAKDAVGRVSQAVQIVNVMPIVSMMSETGKTLLEGTQGSVKFILNGLAPQYPFEVAYEVSGTANDNDHELVSGTVVFTTGKVAYKAFDTLSDAIDEEPESIKVSLLDNTLSANLSITLVDNDADVQVGITAHQDGERRLVIDASKPFSLAYDLKNHIGDDVNANWVFSEDVLDAGGEEGEFYLPENVKTDLLDVTLDVISQLTGEVVASAEMTLTIKDSLQPLDDKDSDNDGVVDVIEGYGDDDLDEVMNFIDPLNDANVQLSMGMLMEVDETSLFILNKNTNVAHKAVSSAGNKPELKDHYVLQQPLEAVIKNVNNVASIVLPLNTPSSSDTKVFTYTDSDEWLAIEPNDDSISSFEGEKGVCLPPASGEYQRGMQEHAWCTLVSIVDGSPMDLDGSVNGEVKVSMLVATPMYDTTPVVLNVVEQTLSNKREAVIDIMSLALNEGVGNMFINKAYASKGSVSVVGDDVYYTPEQGYVGKVNVLYTVDNGSGIYTEGLLVLNMQDNISPVANNDITTTNDQTAITIDVLRNDVDEDGDSLTIESANTTSGMVQVVDNKIVFTPEMGSQGYIVIDYMVSDGNGGNAQGNVKVHVFIKSVNTKSGGSLNMWLLLALMLIVTARIRVRSES